MLRVVIGVCLCMAFGCGVTGCRIAESDLAAEIDELSTDGAIESKYDRWSYVIDGQKYCAAHKILLQEDSVPVLFGDFWFATDYLKAESRTFPNAESEVIITFGGNWDSPETEKVWFCLKCRQVKNDWFAAQVAKQKGDLLRRIGKTPEKKLRSSNGIELLNQAAALGYVDVVKMLLDKGVPVNPRDTSTGSPLHRAAQTDRLEVVKVLIKAGADVNTCDGFVRTPLHYAAWFASKGVVSALVEAGADVNVQDNDGKNSGTTPLSFARTCNLEHRDVAPYLEDLGAVYDPAFINRVKQAKDANSITSLLFEAAENGDYSATKFLIEKGCNIKARDHRGGTPLHSSVLLSGSNPHVVKLIIDAGADINAQDDSGQTALHLAARGKHVGSVRFFISAGADVNIKDDTQKTPLHEAASLGNAEIVKLLLAAGAYPNAKENLFGRTPLHESDLEVSKLLIHAGADVNAKDYFGETPLHHVSKLGFLDVVKLLLEAGADVNVVNKVGKTPLDIAQAEGHKRVAMLLRKYGAQRANP